MLNPYALHGPWDASKTNRHTAIGPFDKRWRAGVEAAVGGAVTTFGVMRAPMERLSSWYRYRQKNPAGDPASTQGISFAEFVQAVLSEDPPAFAKVGSQARFFGWTGAGAAVDMVFDYSRIPDLVEHLSDRLGVALTLPRRNVSEVRPDRAPLILPDDLMARLRAAFAAEFALHYAVMQGDGVLLRD